MKPLRMYRLEGSFDETNFQFVVDQITSGILVSAKITEVEATVPLNSVKVVEKPMSASHSTRPDATHRYGKSEWAEQYWPIFKAAMLKAGDEGLFYMDRELVDGVSGIGSMTNISPLWTYFHRWGRAERAHKRGFHRLTEKGKKE